MKSNVDQMLENLAPDIERKCEELKTARKERLQAREFILLCAAAVLIPTGLVFAGVSLTALIALPVFMSLGVILLLPVLISGKAENQGGNAYEQA